MHARVACVDLTSGGHGRKALDEKCIESRYYYMVDIYLSLSAKQRGMSCAPEAPNLLAIVVEIAFIPYSLHITPHHHHLHLHPPPRHPLHLHRLGRWQ
jgi:hypothetical protein